MWFCDLAINTNSMYFPFIKLFLARYQPNSVRKQNSDVCLSPVVVSKMIQFVPERQTTLRFKKDDQNSKFTITVERTIYNPGNAQYRIFNFVKISFLDSVIAQPIYGAIDNGENEKRMEEERMTSSIKASYNRMVQNLHLISNTNSPSTLDIWLPTSKHIKPLISDQVAGGYFRNFRRNTIETSVEVYYKSMQNGLDYKDGAELFLNEDLEPELLHGSGYAYGMEILTKKQEGRITGWLSYTVSKSMRKIPGINNGKAYPSRYDRTHDLSLVTNYEINKQLSVSANWFFSTGNPVTYPVAKYDVQGNTLFYYSKRNGNRILDYHRLDLSATFNPKKNEYRKVKRTLNISLYNVYARRNAYSIYFRQNEDNPSLTKATRLSRIGLIIPSITYNINY